MSILELVETIIRRPGLYVCNDVTLEKIHLFISGYYVCSCDLGIHDTSFDGFAEFVAQEYHETKTIAWHSIIRYHAASEKDAFDTFVRLFQTFKEGN